LRPVQLGAGCGPLGRGTSLQQTSVDPTASVVAKLHLDYDFDVRWDIFISHASEDKDAVAKPLAELLERAGLRVWLDVGELRLGDSLSQSIDQGLANSRYGVVILSAGFFAKQWPQRELAALVQKEIAGQKVILPVWHGVDHEFVMRFSPTLADKLAVATTNGVKPVAAKIIETLQGTGPSIRSRETTGASEDPDSDTGSQRKLEVLLIGLNPHNERFSETIALLPFVQSVALVASPQQGLSRLRRDRLNTVILDPLGGELQQLADFISTVHREMPGVALIMYTNPLDLEMNRDKLYEGGGRRFDDYYRIDRPRRGQPSTDEVSRVLQQCLLWPSLR